MYGISQEGLLRYEKDGWKELGWPECVLTGWVRTAAVVSDDEYWLSYRTREGFTHARRDGAGKPWRCEHFEAKGDFRETRSFCDWTGRVGCGAGRRPGCFLRGMPSGGHRFGLRIGIWWEGRWG